jgi:hyperosmotically inducible protein
MKRTALNLSLCAGATLVAATLAGAAVAEQTTSPTSNVESTKEYLDDAAITTKVKAALIAEKETKATEVKVETDKGVVHLTGTVDNSQMATKAEDVAKSVKGVQSVKNDLRVR